MKKLITISLLLLLSSCAGEPEELKSPCVGAEGSPCDNRSPINIQFKQYYREDLQRKLFV